MRTTLLLALVLGVSALLAATASAATVATPGAATSVRQHQRTVVFSQYEQATGQWRLAVRPNDGSPVRLLPVAPADRPFDADIGPGSNGGLQLVYRRCDETCDLFTYALGGIGTPRGERPIRSANDPDHDDVHPTVWNGRLAWARIYGQQRDRRVVVYTREIAGGPGARRPPSTRLRGVPERRCGDVEPQRCGPTTGRSVDALELSGDRLAQVVGYECRGCSGIRQAEVRLVGVRDASAQQVAFQTVGLSGQAFAGPSIEQGRLLWYRTCLGDPDGCRGGVAGVFRYAIAARRYDRSSGPVRVDGFADASNIQFQALGCSVETAPELNRACRIEQVPRPAYRPTRAPLRRSR